MYSEPVPDSGQRHWACLMAQYARKGGGKATQSNSFEGRYFMTSSRWFLLSVEPIAYDFRRIPAESFIHSRSWYPMQIMKSATQGRGITSPSVRVNRQLAATKNFLLTAAADTRLYIFSQCEIFSTLVYRYFSEWCSPEMRLLPRLASLE